MPTQNPSQPHQPFGGGTQQPSSGPGGGSASLPSLGGGAPTSQGNLPMMAVPAQPSAIAYSAGGAAAQAVVGPAGMTGPQFQKLKVEDALSYLDQVKLQFGNQPQVYNDFLDIMKDFKSQAIDTPGVIGKVSDLFKGHPDLIVGFNTFLPPGYKIEVQGNETVSVHQPGHPVQMLVPGAGLQAIGPIPRSLPETKAPALPPSSAPVQSSAFSLGLGALPPPSGPPPVSAPPGGPHGGAPKPSQTVLPSLNIPLHDIHKLTHPTSQLMRAAQLIPPTGPINMGAMGDGGAATTAGGQPVEFNHAINYVNKIKNRFQGQPEIYKSFLEILHTYQKEQRNTKEPHVFKPLTETEVYSQVAKLFKNQEDLLSEFGQFLPDANGAAFMGGWGPSAAQMQMDSTLGVRNDHSSTVRKPPTNTKPLAPKTGGGAGQVRKAAGPPPHAAPPKKAKLPPMIKDTSLAEAAKWGSLMEFDIFDKIAKALKPPGVYDNFLRCLQLFNLEIVTRQELMQLVNPFLVKHPQLYRELKNFVGYKEAGGYQQPSMSQPQHQQPPIKQELRPQTREPHFLDMSRLKQLGHSYRALPPTVQQPKCSGQTDLCRGVLNTEWVSFPSYTEGESSSFTSRKSQYEEAIFRTEDERFELDQVIETNLCAIRALDGVARKLQRMNNEDSAKFRLDNTLGGTSEVLQRKAIQRIYGDKAGEIIDGLKRNPVVAVPLVLRRLKMKDEEWREGQKGFNKIWREQNEKYYLKSLDYQCVSFKQSDAKTLRSKNLQNEIEAIYDERQDRMSEGAAPDLRPHLTYMFKHQSVLEDTAALIVHHVKRQTNLSKEDKGAVKQIMFQTLPRMLGVTEAELSEDEDEGSDSESEEGKKEEGEESRRRLRDRDRSHAAPDKSPRAASGYADRKRNLLEDMRERAGLMEAEVPTGRQDVRMFANNAWYILLRLHQLLYSRLERVFVLAVEAAEEERRTAEHRRENTATALRLIRESEVEVEEQYPHFLQLVRALLDGNIEPSAYEDSLRQMFGIEAYITFTLDKLVSSITRHLQSIVADEQNRKILTLFEDEVTWGDNTIPRPASPTSTTEKNNAQLAYQRRVEQLITDGENCYRVEVVSQPRSLAITLLDNDEQGQDPASVLSEVGRWSEAVGRLVADVPENEVRGAVRAHLDSRPLFLLRTLWHRTREGKEAAARGKASDKSNGEEGSGVRSRSSRADLVVVDNEERRVVPRSYRFPVVKGKAATPYVLIYFRRNPSTQSRAAACKRRGERFGSFVSRWCDENVSEEGVKECEDWLLGVSTSHVATTRRAVDKPDSPPYRTYYRYEVRESKGEEPVSQPKEEQGEKSPAAEPQETEKPPEPMDTAQ